jgi:hypothetical protein
MARFSREQYSLAWFSRAGIFLDTQTIRTSFWVSPNNAQGRRNRQQNLWMQVNNGQPKGQSAFLSLTALRKAPHSPNSLDLSPFAFAVFPT